MYTSEAIDYISHVVRPSLATEAVPVLACASDMILHPILPVPYPVRPSRDSRFSQARLKTNQVSGTKEDVIRTMRHAGAGVASETSCGMYASDRRQQGSERARELCRRTHQQ